MTADHANEVSQTDIGKTAGKKKRNNGSARMVVTLLLWVVSVGVFIWLCCADHLDYYLITQYRSMLQCWWYMALLALDIGVMIWAMIGLAVDIKNRNQKLLSVLSLILILGLLGVSVCSGITLTAQMEHVRNGLDPYYLLRSEFSESDTKNILADLENYGLYDSEVDYTRYLNTDAFPCLYILNENEDICTSFILWDSYFDPYFWEEGWIDYRGDCYATVVDGSVKTVTFEIASEKYYFVTDGELAAEPKGSYMFASAANNNMGSLIQPAAERMIAQDVGAEDGELSFVWRSPEKIDGTEPWSLMVRGYCEDENNKTEFYVYVQALTDEEINDAIASEDGLPIAWTYEIME